MQCTRVSTRVHIALCFSSGAACHTSVPACTALCTSHTPVQLAALGREPPLRAPQAAAPCLQLPAVGQRSGQVAQEVRAIHVDESWGQQPAVRSTGAAREQASVAGVPIQCTAPRPFQTTVSSVRGGAAGGSGWCAAGGRARARGCACMWPAMHEGRRTLLQRAHARARTVRVPHVLIQVPSAPGGYLVHCPCSTTQKGERHSSRRGRPPGAKNAASSSSTSAVVTGWRVTAAAGSWSLACGARMRG